MQNPSNLSEQKLSDLPKVDELLQKQPENYKKSFDFDDQTQPTGNEKHDPLDLPDSSPSPDLEARITLGKKEPSQPDTEIERRESFGKSIMAVRESRLPPKLPLTELTVNPPRQKTSTLLPYNSYKLDFIWEGKPLSVERRYSNVEFLRNALTVLLPFTYIPPAHHKRLQPGGDSEFLKRRLAELTRFFQHIVANPHKFNLR